MNTALKSFVRNYRYSAIRLTAIVFTIVVLVVQKDLPSTELQLVPSDQTYPAIFGSELAPGTPSVEWLNDKSTKFKCVNKADFDYSCGYSLALTGELASGLDLTQYDHFKIRLKHQGDARQVRFSLRNYNPAYATGDRAESSKFMSVVLQTSDLEGELVVKLDEFAVAEWWLTRYNIPRKYSTPEFNYVISLGLDFISAGENTIEIENISLEGSKLPKEKLYLTLLGFWLLVLLWESISKLVQMYRHYKHTQRERAKLIEENKILEEAKNKYETLSTTDTLTGIANRAGIQQFLSTAFERAHEQNRLGLVLVDVDHFKRINDTRGHAFGDRVLAEIAQTIKSSVRESDMFGRWGGEEFLLICPQSSPEQIKLIAEKLRAQVAQHEFDRERPLRVTVSAGATIVQIGESYDEAFQRLDEALYAAKRSGRNAVIYRG